MHKLILHCVGKPREKWINEGVDDFISRMKPYADFKIQYYKSNADLEKLEVPYIALSPEGQEFDSVSFSKFIMKSFEKEGATLHFIIGAAEGLSLKLKEKAKSLLSLSTMTLTHEMAKLFFVEQVYRAFEIYFNRGYHK
jgi:23S rRNA (pseudouridine1915-N3)-methyltransferase